MGAPVHRPQRSAIPFCGRCERRGRATSCGHRFLPCKRPSACDRHMPVAGPDLQQRQATYSLARAIRRSNSIVVCVPPNQSLIRCKSRSDAAISASVPRSSSSSSGITMRCMRSCAWGGENSGHSCLHQNLSYKVCRRPRRSGGVLRKGDVVDQVASYDEVSESWELQKLHSLVAQEDRKVRRRREPAGKAQRHLLFLRHKRPE